MYCDQIRISNVSEKRIVIRGWMQKSLSRRFIDAFLNNFHFNSSNWTVRMNANSGLVLSKNKRHFWFEMCIWLAIWSRATGHQHRELFAWDYTHCFLYIHCTMYNVVQVNNEDKGVKNKNTKCYHIQHYRSLTAYYIFNGEKEY